MKEVIKKWIKNGGDLQGLTCKTNYKVATILFADIVDNNLVVDYELPNIDNNFTYSENIYRLVFDPSLQFIDTLVGKRKLCIVEPVSFCDTKYNERTKLDKDNIPRNNKCDFFSLSHFKGRREMCIHEMDNDTAIDFHRAQMANKKSIEELKEYVRGLI